MPIIKKYRPRSGTEGEAFKCFFCYRCKKYNYNKFNKTSCSILVNSVVWDIDDPEYPEQWQYNEKDIAACTEFDSSDARRNVE